jgi:biuret amidohydrolase
MSDRLKNLLANGRTAVILCEVQEGVLGSAAPWPQLSDAAKAVNLVENVKAISACARSHGAPVIHCTAEFLSSGFGGNSNARLFGSAKKKRNTDEAAKVNAAKFSSPMAGTFADGDILLPRLHGLSPMTGSSLDTLLRNERIDTLIITGVSISFAITSLIMDAVHRAYQVILPRDAAAGFPVAYADQVIEHTLSMLATLTTSAELIAAWNEAA